MKNFYEAVKKRRSYYEIDGEKVVSEEKIEELVKEAVKYTPTAFNSQSSRVIVLFDDNHKKLWDIVEESLRNIVPVEQFESTEKKMAGFRNGYGTIMFFEDDSVIKSLQTQYELYKDNFPVWAEQSNGILQFVVWTSLELEGLGASLQHYNPLIDNQVKREWGIPNNWRLIAQMPFGNPTKKPGEKEFQTIEERVRVIK